jgi:hypothetical protein
MTRGPESITGFAATLPVARQRGHVDLFRHGRGSMASFLIAGSGMLAIVRLHKASRLHGTVADMSAAFREVIEDLRMYPAGGPVLRELWLFSRYGVLRFFRVEDSGITEIGPDGKVLPEPPISGASG